MTATDTHGELKTLCVTGCDGTWGTLNLVVSVFMLSTDRCKLIFRQFVDLPRLAPVSNVNFFSKTDYLSKIAIFKLHLEVEVIGLDITKFDYQRG